jgi:cytochrome o ubiquinol oxidase operon protein cyoD
MNTTLRSYLIGLVLSLACTATAFGIMHAHLSFGHHVFSYQFLIGTLTALAFIQLLTQLVFFLHVGKRSNAWNTLAVVLTILMVAFIVAGSLWIMTHLAHNTHVPFSGSVTPQHEMR